LNLPWAKVVVIFAPIERLRRLALPEQLGSSIDSYAGEPGRELGSSLETADMFESLQKHVLCNIPGIVQAPKEASQSTEDSPRVPAHQFFECVSVSPLNSDDNCSIGILGRSGIGNQTGWAGGRIQIFSREYAAWREIGHCAQPSLNSIEKICHCCHRHGFQDLRFAESVFSQGCRLEPPLR